MNTKAIAVVLIIALALILGFALKTANRAAAAAGNCYSASQGPSTPSICN